jgi:hypothetical protein
MPEFTTEATIEIDVEEFVNSCSDADITDLIDVLIEQGCISQSNRVDNLLPSEEMWHDTVEKLKLIYLSLSNKEIEIIENIANRY